MKEKSMGVPELSRAKMITLTLCFFLVFFVASDTLILSTASVSILNDLGGQQHYSLIFPFVVLPLQLPACSAAA